MLITPGTVRIAKEVFLYRVNKIRRRYGMPAIIQHAGLIQNAFNKITPAYLIWKSQFITLKQPGRARSLK